MLGIECSGELDAAGPGDATYEWIAGFDAAGVPAGQITFAEELWDDPHVLANQMAAELEHSLVGKVRMASPLAKLSDTYVESDAASPALGEHTEGILGELGYDSERVEALRRRGVTA